MNEGNVCCYEGEILNRYNKKLSDIISIQQNQYNGIITICIADGDRIFLTPQLQMLKSGITAEIKIEHFKKDDLFILKSLDSDKK